MHRSFGALVLASALSAPVHAASWIVDATVDGPAQIDLLARTLAHPGYDPSKHTARFEADDAQIAQLRALGVELQLDLAASARLTQFTAAAGRGAAGIPGYACYRTVEESFDRMDQLATEHADLADVVDVGSSWRRTQDAASGYPLRVLRLTNHATDAAFPDKPALFVIGAIHAREYVTAETALRFGEQLVEQYGHDADATWLLDHYRFHLLIQANPDGRKIAETGVLWRKNVDDTNGVCDAQPPSASYHAGVDLNRNEPFNWNAGGATDDVCAQTYRGPIAASEPETQAIVAYVAGVQSAANAPFTGGLFADRRADDHTSAAPDDTSGVLLDLHSNGRLVLWPWGDTATPSPNDAALARFGRRIGWFNSYLPIVSNGIGATSGTAPDTAYGYLGVAAYTIELGGLDFFQDCDAFLADTLPKNLAGLRYIARNLDAPYTLPAGPDARDVHADHDLIVLGEQTALHAVVDDDGFNTYNAIEPVQAIAAASTRVDALSATAIPMTADDGAFDHTAEAVSATLDADTLGLGRHLVYVQGTDVDGNDGPPAAAFVEVAGAAAVATVQGHTRDARTGVPIAAAIEIDDGAGDTHRANSASVDGAFALHAHTGAAVLNAHRFNYLDESIALAPLAAGQTQTQDVSLIPACSAFADDAESGNVGWTATPAQSWGIVEPVSGRHYWNDSPAGTYPSNADLRLTSPSLDFSSYDSVVLTFEQRCYTEETYDFGTVELSLDAAHTQWTEVYRCSGMPQWQHATVELPSAAGHSDVRIRFRTRSDASGDFDGWSLDDIRIGRDDAACRAAFDSIFANGFDA